MLFAVLESGRLSGCGEAEPRNDSVSVSANMNFAHADRPVRPLRALQKTQTCITRDGLFDAFVVNM